MQFFCISYVKYDVFIKISNECKMNMNPFGGRLAEYKYYDMAPIIEKVFEV